MAHDIHQRIVITAKDRTTRGFRAVEKKLGVIERLLSRVKTTMLGFVGLNIAGNIVKGLARMSDSVVELQAKLRLVTNSVEDFTDANKGLLEISINTGSELEANTTLFVRMAKPMQRLGYETAQTLKFTNLLAQGLRISGASQQESASVIRQMSQAMASGVLRGEEFNAVSENGFRIMGALGEALNKTQGELRAMSKAGELTAKVVTDALLSQASVIDAENKKLPITIGRALENIKTQYLAFSQTQMGVNTAIADSINAVAANFDTIFAGVLQGALILTTVVAVKLGKFYQQRAVDALNTRRRAKQKEIDDQRELHMLARKDDLAQKSALFNAKRASTQATLDAKAVAIQRRKLILAQELNVVESGQSATYTKRLIQSEKDLALQIKRQALTVEQIALLAKENEIVEANNKLSYTRRSELTKAQAQEARLAKTIASHNKMSYTRRIELTKAQAQEARLAKTIASHNVAVSKLSIAQATDTKVSARLSKVKLDLHKNEIALANAVNAERIAHYKNTTAMALSAKATKALAVSKAGLATSSSILGFGFGGLATKGGLLAKKLRRLVKSGGLARFALKGLTSGIGRLGLAMFGLPGLLAFVGYELVSRFVDMELAGKAWSVELEKVMARVIYAFNAPALQQALAKIDADFATWSDKRIAEQQRISQGLKGEADTQMSIAKRLKQSLKLIRNQSDELMSQATAKMISLYEAELAQQQANDEFDVGATNRKIARIDRALQSNIIGLAKLGLSKADHEVQVSALEAQAEKDRSTTLVKSLERKLKSWGLFYKEQAAILDKGVAGVKKYAGKAHDALLKVHTDDLKMAKATNEEIVSELQKRVSDSISAYNAYVQGVADATAKIAGYETELANLESYLLGEKSSSQSLFFTNQQKITDADAKLKKASHLDVKTQSKEIEKLQTEALSTLSEIAKSEKDRAKSLKAGSADELEAITNSNSAMGSYRKGIDQAKTSQKEFADHRKTMAEQAKIDAEATQKHIEDLLLEIKKIDDTLKLRRAIKLEVESSQVHKELDKIEGRIDDLNKKTIRLTTRITADEDIVQKKHNGGVIRRSGGGWVPRQNKVPGHGSGDKVRALLEPGEWIIRKRAVMELGGDQAMARINRGELPVQKLQTGGRVSRRVDQLMDSLKLARNDANAITNSSGHETYVSAGNADRGRAVKVRTDKYYSDLVSLVDKLYSKDYRTYSSASTLVGEAQRLIFSSEQGEKSSIDPIMDRLRRVIADGDAPVKKSESPSPKLEREGSRKATKARVKEAATTQDTNPFVGITTALTNSVNSALKSVSASVSHGVATGGAPIRPSVQPPIQPPPPTPQKTIQVDLVAGGNSTKGVFPDDYSTAEVLSILRESGKVA